MLTLLLSLSVAAAIAPADVRVTHSHLVVTCVNGQRVDGKTRHWRPSRPMQLTFTMRNEPRPGVANHEPGLAVISFSAEVNHRYEIEIRANVESYSTRVWKRSEWKPVVRDRTTDAIVSGEPRWIERGCS
jgi:hypothetical protein